MDLLKITRKTPILFVIFYFFILLGVSYANDIKDVNKLKEPIFPKEITVLGKINYDWALKSLDGKDFNLRQARGKIIFINIWATWCAPCRAEMPSFQKLYNKMKNKAVFIFASDEKAETISDFLKRNKYDLPAYVYFQSPQFKPELFFLALPSTYIIDSRGQVIFREVGSADWSTQKTINFLRSLK